MAKANHGKGKKGIACSGTWLPVPLEFLRSRACAELSPLASKLLLDVFGLLGTNAIRNGDLSLTPKLMAQRGWTSRASLGAAVKELEDHGLLARTRQGSRLDCNLFACTLYPLDCDLRKLDVRPGSYRQTDYMGTGASLANPPTESNPAVWRRARKTKTLSPQRNEEDPQRSATEQSKVKDVHKKETSFRGGTKPSFTPLSIVPQRDTYLDMPSINAGVRRISARTAQLCRAIAIPGRLPLIANGRLHANARLGSGYEY